MATLTDTAILKAGTTVPFVAATSGGDSAPTGSQFLLLVKNADASSHAVTLAVPGTVDGLAIASRVVNVAAGATAVIPLLDEYNNPATNLASITYSSVVTTTVAVVSL